MLDSLKTQVNKEERRKKKSKKKEKNEEKSHAKKEKKEEKKSVTTTSSVVQTQPIVKKTAPDSLANYRLFGAHLLQPKTTKPSIHYINNLTWLGWLIIACYSLFIIARRNYRKRLSNLFHYFFSYGTSDASARKENPLSNRLTIILSVLFLILAGLYALQLNNYYAFFPSLSGFTHSNYVQIVFIAFFVYLIKFALISAAGAIFNTQAETSYHLSTVFLTNSILSFILFPLTVLIQFSSLASTQTLIGLSVVVLLLFHTYRLFKLFYTGMWQLRVGKFYLFLYLCTLEILPLVVLIKLLMR